VPDGSGPATLRLSYQLKDASGRTAVDASHLKLVPLLSYPAGAAPLPAVNATANELPGCGAATADPVSGVGECAAAVDARFFPAAGALTASLTLELRNG
jgi:hypothetical protein